MNRLPSLNLLTAFEAVARYGSVSKAADQLNLTPSAVSHRLSKLEDHLGVILCERTRDGMRLTAEGVTYSTALRDALEQIVQLSKCLTPNEENNSLCVQTGPGFGRLWLIPKLKEFKETCPDIKLELSASFEPVNFDEGQVDLWIHRNLIESDLLAVEKLFDEQFVPLASSPYLKKQPLKELFDLTNASLIYCTRNKPNWSDWFSKYDLQAPHLDWSLAVSHAGHSLQAAMQGLGVVLESLQLTESFRRDGRLVEVFSQDAAIEGPGQFIICPPSHLERPPVQRFLKWLRSACG